MSTSTKLPVNRIRFVGIFDIDILVRAILDWMEGEAFFTNEKKHKYKITPTGSSTFEIGLTGQRNYDTYFQYLIAVDIKTEGCREIEITKGKNVIKALHGRITMWIKPTLVRDWQDKFEGKFLERLQSYYHKFIINRRFGGHWDRLFYLARNGLETAIKEALQYQTVMKRG